AAYALLAYQTAWLKAHYPHEFFAASMCFDMALTDKLGVFVDDMRRLGVAILPPCINASAAEFNVEQGAEGLAVRYALAALKSVGEGAMERLVAERRERGAFTSIDDLAARVDPRLLNKRQVETLAAAGAFDGLDPNRAGIFACAETILAVASRLHDQRTSGQAGLFGDAEPASGASIKPPQSAHWSMAERMEQEREAFGFYFSAHPVDRFKHLARLHGARTYVELGDIDIPEGGARVGATMAVLVEDARWRTSAKGRRYLMATLSDPSGQFIATCFDDGVATALEEAARAGGCALATVELDRRPGEETPRVTVKKLQAFETLASNARMAMEVTVETPEGMQALCRLLAELRGARGEVMVRATLPQGGAAQIRLGRAFLLDHELAQRIEAMQGVSHVTLKTVENRPLALAG
ncbi:MAG: DNA polymerase III subunit alpha, partial [Sphingomonas sp.]